MENNMPSNSDMEWKSVENSKKKKILKWIWIIIWWILWLFFIVLSFQWLFFSYSEKNFDIPKDYFEGIKWYDADAKSEKNWFNEYVQYIYKSKETPNLNATESFSEEDERKIIQGEKIEWWNYNNYYGVKYNCEVSNIGCSEFEHNITDNKWKNEIDLKELEYNGRIFNEYVNFVNEIYKIFEKLKEKEFIKYDCIWPECRFLYLQWLLELERGISGIAITYIENWEYEKWINMLVKRREVIDTISEKKYYYNLIEPIIDIYLSTTNYQAINYVLDNYWENISRNLKEKLLTELKKTIREWIIVDGIKNHYKRIKNYKYYNNMEVSGMSLTLLEQFAFKYNLLFLIYSENDTDALFIKSAYDSIESAYSKDHKILSNEVCGNNHWLTFWLKYVHNFLWRVALICADSEDYANYINNEIDTLKQRQDLVQKLKEELK